ncbi:Pre-mRNA 3'-end-processing factor FIP1 [Spatholobus suberectus]|nr:Pre-mRNA 3'-end-processing factor FIP1 [Spatholobus suberectus]
MKESSPLYCKNSKNNSVNKRAVNVAYNSRTRGQFRNEWRHESGGYEPGYNLNKHTENDNDVSSILKSSSRDLSLLACRFVDYGRHKDKLQAFGSHKRRDVSYDRETKQSCYYGGEKVVDVVTRHSKYYHEYRERFRENTNQYDRKHGYGGDYFFEPGPQFADSEDRERDWYPPGCGYSADDLSPCSYRELRQFLPKHSSFPDKERDTQRKRMDEKSYFIDRNCIDDFDECEFEVLNKSYRMSTSAAEREMEPLDNNREEQFPHIDRVWRRSVRRGRHCDRPPLILNNLCSGIME